MARRSDHSREDLKRLSIDVAKKIITESGYESLTARKLAQEIGYTPGTLYNIFGSMHGVMFAVNYETLLSLEVNLTKSIKQNSNLPIDSKLKEMAKTYIDFSYAERNLWLAVFQHNLPQEHTSPEWYKEKIINLFSRLEEILGKSKDFKMASRTLWSSIHGICFIEQTNKMEIIGGYSPYEMSNFLIEKFIKGLDH